MLVPVLAAVAVIAAAAGPKIVPATPAPARPVGSIPSSLELLSPGRFGEIALSPNGRYLALVRRQGIKDVVVVVDRTAKSQALAFDKADMATLDIRDLVWKGDDRLVVFWRGFSVRTRNGEIQTRTLGDQTLGVIDEFDSGVSSVARSGGPLTDLGEGSLAASLPDNPATIMVAQFERRDRRTNSPRARASYYPTAALFSVDVNTGVRTQIEKGIPGTYDWDVDASGTAAVRYDIYGRQGGMRVMGRAPDGSWNESFVLRPKELNAMDDIALLGPTAKPGKFYVAVKSSETTGARTRELRVYDFVNRTMGELVWSHPSYDFEGIVTDVRTQELRAVCYWADVFTCDYLDPAEAREAKAIEGFFTGDRSVALAAASADNAVRLLYVTGPDEPGSYYVYDRATRKVELLGSAFPGLKPDRLGPMTRHGWKSRDGVDLTGYLTAPPAAARGKLPLIVMPHGGPEARDNFAFEAWAQAFATRGYLVFQPNFRGSGGFGSAWAEQGYGQWGLRMQDDVLDGVRDLIAKGLVDPDRICIVGASYGGYVALQAGAKNPELFKCVVSRAGVSDLNAMMKWEKVHFDEDSPRYQYWVKSIGDPSRDADRLTANSPVTYAKTYRPPVLLLHGDWDFTVPYEQSTIMEKALNAAGRPVELVKFEGQGHSGWQTRSDVDGLDRILAFVDKAIGAKPQ